jgi:hypothetical protein
VNSYGTTTASDVARAAAKQTEHLILEQLNDFVSRGLLVIELGPMSFYRDVTTPDYTLKISQSVKLVLKDKEYIEKLEAKNKELNEIVAKLKAVLP